MVAHLSRPGTRRWGGCLAKVLIKKYFIEQYNSFNFLSGGSTLIFEVELLKIERKDEL